MGFGDSGACGSSTATGECGGNSNGGGHYPGMLFRVITVPRKTGEA
jgi:hypothetical protein